MRVKDAVGRWGEQVAATHLTDAGLTILSRNWRCRDGELDIVARDGAELVFVEVKTRSTIAFGLPSEAVTAAKMARIRILSIRWIQERRAAGGADGADGAFWDALRFDVVSVLRGRDGGGSSVQHVRGAF